MFRFFLLMMALGLLVVLPFVIWGEGMDTIWTVAHLTSYGRWAWAVGVGLLVGDLLMPIPSTVVMSGLGYVYGVLIGGLVATAGAMGSAMLGKVSGIGRDMESERFTYHRWQFPRLAIAEL